MGKSSSVVERYTVSHAAGYFLTDEVVVVVVGALVVEVVGFWVAVVVGAIIEVVAEEAAVPRVVVVVEEAVADAEDDATDDAAVEVGVDAVAVVLVVVTAEEDPWKSEADGGDVTDADTEADKVVVAIEVRLCADAVVCDDADVPMGVAVGVVRFCGSEGHTAHTAAHNTNTAAVTDSHRTGTYLGVGTTRFSVSAVIQAEQKRAFSRKSAPQCGQRFILFYPNVSKSLSNKISLISITDNCLQIP